MNIHLLKYGKGKPLVFFHGWGFDSSIWLSLVSTLKDSYEVILVDLPGFGFTPMMEWSVFKETLLQLLPLNFSLVGWSMGGLYALRLAQEEPDRVHHVLMVTASPKFIAEAFWPGVAEEVFSGFYQKLSIDVMSTLKEFIRLQSRNIDLEVPISFFPSPAGLKEGLHVLKNWDLRQALQSINIPLCFLFGRLDPITPVRTMKVMQELYPDFRYVVFNQSAHMPFLSHRDDFLNEILGFIQ